ncbi:MAG: Gfo/Idh/MocA family protein [Phycisphaerae bacterium]
MKVGVIGLGGMGRHHARVIRGFKFVREIIGCDLSAECRAKAEKDGMRTVPDIPALLALEPDAVFVITQATVHAAAIEPCLRAGLPVFTEKPLATNLADCRRLVALAARKRVPFQVGFELRCCGMTRAMNDVLKSGLIGKPLHGSLVQLSGPHSGAHMARKRTGGIFYEKLCHQVDTFRMWLGEPKRIMAISGTNALKQYEIPDNVLACMEFPGGKTGKILFQTTRAAQVGGTSDFGDRGHFYEMTLTCTKGSLTYSPWTDTLSVVRFNHRPDCQNELVDRFIVSFRYGESVYDLWTEDGEFLRRVKRGKPPAFPASDALKTMEWVAKAEKSLASRGAWVS